MSDAELLDHYAGLAMQSILASNLEPQACGRDVAKLAYNYAQHMLDERQERLDRKNGVGQRNGVEYAWAKQGAFA